MKVPVLLVSSILACSSSSGTNDTSHPPATTCPQVTSTATLVFPANPAAAVKSVKADFPCVAVSVGPALDGSAGAYVVGSGRDTIAASCTCLVHANLTDGTTLEATVTFHPLGGTDAFCWGIPTTDTPVVIFEYEHDAGTD
jgi:hypothetical protein